MTKSNPTLEKFRLMANYDSSKMSSQDLGRRINEIDYHARSKDSKMIESVCRKGGKGLMLAGILSLTIPLYQSYRQPLDEAKYKKVIVAGFGLAYIGLGLYNLRRKEWDQFENNSK